MENTQHPYPLANNFFYKFYNYNLEDSAMLALVPNVLYAHVSKEIMFFKSNESMSQMDIMQFHKLLFAQIKLRYAAQHEALVKQIGEL